MRILLMAFGLFWCANAMAQKPIALPHGMVYGSKPDTTQSILSANLETYMGRKARISTTLRGKIIKVTMQKGGWFLVDVGKGKTIEAHFKDYNVTLPFQLAGRTVLIEGIAAKQFKADPSQHYAGDNATKKAPVQGKLKIDFEVKGMMIYK